MTSLNVSGLTKVWQFDCSNNSLTALDLPETAIGGFLDCSNNLLSRLEISGTIFSLNCSDNLLTELNLSETRISWGLNCSGNSLNILDISPSREMREFNCEGNSSLETVWVWDDFDTTNPAVNFEVGYTNDTSAVFKVKE